MERNLSRLPYTAAFVSSSHRAGGRIAVIVGRAYSAARHRKRAQIMKFAGSTPQFITIFPHSSYASRCLQDGCFFFFFVRC